MRVYVRRPDDVLVGFSCGPARMWAEFAHGVRGREATGQIRFVSSDVGQGSDSGSSRVLAEFGGCLCAMLTRAVVGDCGGVVEERGDLSPGSAERGKV